MHGWRRRRPYTGTGHRRPAWRPAVYGRSITPNSIKGKTYFEYNIGDHQKLVIGSSTLTPGNNDWFYAGTDGKIKDENPPVVKTGRICQSLRQTTSPAPLLRDAPCWNSISMNHPIISYTSPALSVVNGFGGFDPKWGYFPPDLGSGWNNISEYANRYKFCTIYNTYLKITALPASVDPAGAGAPVGSYNFDSLGIWFCFPNEVNGDDDFLGNMSVQNNAGINMSSNIDRVTDPLWWYQQDKASGGFTDATMANRDTRVRFIPLNSPNYVGGGRTILTARWRLKGNKWSNAAPSVSSAAIAIPYTGSTHQNYYEFSRSYDPQNYSANANIVNHRFYWSLGTNMGTASYDYRYKFKIQMWCDYICWEPFETIPKFIGGVPSYDSGAYRAEEENSDDMDQDQLPSVPATPVLEQMFTEFARLQEKMGKSHSSVQITDK